MAAGSPGLHCVGAGRSDRRGPAFAPPAGAPAASARGASARPALGALALGSAVAVRAAGLAVQRCWATARATSQGPRPGARARPPRQGIYCAAEASGATGISAPGPLGLKAWRALPSEHPDNLAKLLRDQYNDIVLEEIDATPLRSTVVLPLPSVAVPCVGQVRKTRLSWEQARVAWSAAEGFLACVPLIRESMALPRGGVGVELLSTEADGGEDGVLATLRGVTCLRLLDRANLDDGSPQRRLVQEVCEWSGDQPSSAAAQRAMEELARLESLFRACGELQERTGIWGAGDLRSRSLAELTDAAQNTMDGVFMAGLGDGAGDSVHAAAQRRLALAGHAAVSALASKREEFLCDPTRTLERIRRLSKFLSLMEDVLRRRVG
ncbi:unnamed protein product [Prorocentrum cordatum]|uniref:Uncharacterized protein n=1 Tax=Prorocentrum cordatum TaxID=2364126 RepID=A0ABN9RBW1_9DINO|nr:unnamed protein product [Polarella glacialis]